MEFTNQELADKYNSIVKQVNEDIYNAHSQILTRQKLIREIEERRKAKLIVYVSKMDYMIDYDDIVSITAMLDQVGETDNIDLLIHSGGGSGTVAEKIVEMIRQYCKNEFKVIVPNIAKSAATMIALAADRIVMGVSSELGPIDPQLQTVQGGRVFLISAQSFVDARDRLEQKAREAAERDEPMQPYLVQLGSLNSGFIDYCEKAIAFAKDFATKSLEKYMLREKENAHELAERIATDLCSASEYFTHGRTISAGFIKNRPQLNELKVDVLSKESQDWKMLLELYIRCELYLDMDNKPGVRKSKLYESASFSMTGEAPTT
jgi:ATP-dependent protease ClpP protease subunit